MKKILLTGGSGFIGRHCGPLLDKAGYEIISPRHSNYDLLNFNDIKTLTTKVKASHLLHFAWDVTPANYWNNMNNYDWLIASMELIKQFHNNGGERVVTAGTCAEYDWSVNGIYDEYNTPLNPFSRYGQCKKLLYEFLQSYAKDNLSYAHGRIFYLYGPHEHPTRLIPSAIKAFLNNQEFNTSPGEQIRDYMYVEDVAAAFVKLLDSNVQGAVNIASGTAIPLKEILYITQDLIRKRDLIKLGTLPYNPAEPMKMVPSVERLKKEVGFEARYGLGERMEEMVGIYSDG